MYSSSHKVHFKVKYQPPSSSNTVIKRPVECSMSDFASLDCFKAKVGQIKKDEFPFYIVVEENDFREEKILNERSFPMFTSYSQAKSNYPIFSEPEASKTKEQSIKLRLVRFGDVATPDDKLDETSMTIQTTFCDQPPAEKPTSAAVGPSSLSQDPASSEELAAALSELLQSDLIKTFVLRKVNARSEDLKIKKGQSIRLNLSNEFHDKLATLIKTSLASPEQL